MLGRFGSEASKDGQETMDHAKGNLEEKRIKDICNAKKITFDDYADLQVKRDKGIKLSKDEEMSMRRHEIESFYREEISPELVGLDKKGAYREQVRMMQLYLSPLDHLAKKGQAERMAEHFATDLSNASAHTRLS